MGYIAPHNKFGVYRKSSDPLFTPSAQSFSEEAAPEERTSGRPLRLSHHCGTCDTVPVFNPRVAIQYAG